MINLTYLILTDNLTTEQYSGVVPRQINALNVSRDSLNPLLNTTILKQRLLDIEHYKYLNGHLYARWPHYAMKNAGRYMWRYKINLAVKGAAAYMTYREINNHINMNEKTVPTFEQSLTSFVLIGIQGGIFGTLCAFI